MKKYILLCTAFLFVLISHSQYIKGKKASLNEDGSLNVEDIIMKSGFEKSANNYELLPGFPIGRPNNPTFKNFRGATLVDLDGDNIPEILYGANDKLIAVNGSGEETWTKSRFGNSIYHIVTS